MKTEHVNIGTIFGLSSIRKVFFLYSDDKNRTKFLTIVIDP